MSRTDVVFAHQVRLSEFQTISEKVSVHGKYVCAH